MANRAYLYTCEKNPNGDGLCNFKGISEWSYDIPVLYKILVSSQTQTFQSQVFEGDEHIALIGDFSGGVAALKDFVAKIKRKDSVPLIEETLAFLESHSSSERYFLLECAEIYDMASPDFEGQNQQLLKEVQDFAPMASYIVELLHEEQPRKGFNVFLGMLKTAQYVKTLEDVYELGFGNWSSTLCAMPQEA
ncbi:DUF7822 domain-containing protein [Vibrio owensii]|uniref:DUF7822 domain-containing protein n=1 Tax=Vibrio owensii TaxID=696485 RepID=UPI0038CF1483